MKCVFCKTGIILVNIIYMNFRLPGLNMKHENSYKKTKHPYSKNVLKRLPSCLLSKTRLKGTK